MGFLFLFAFFHCESEGGFRTGGGKMDMRIGHNRRALSNINKNIVGVPPYPYAVNKNVFSE